MAAYWAETETSPPPDAPTDVLLDARAPAVSANQNNNAPPATDASAGAQAELCHLNGLVERVTFHNPEQDGFCVLRVKVKGRRDLETLIGNAAAVSPGEYIEAAGQWKVDRQYGRQFVARHLRVSEPSTLEGIEKYLGSGMIKGIGPHCARQLVQRFGLAVFEVIERLPERLTDVEGIGPKRAEKITRGWDDQKAIRRIMVFLHAIGVSTSRAVRVFKTYGQEAEAIIRANPYRLAHDIKGVGFLTADRVAARLGIDRNSIERARAGISYALSEMMGDGHCGVPADLLAAKAAELLEVDDSLIQEAVRLELEAAHIARDGIGDQDCLFLPYLHAAEQGIAERLLRLAQGPLPWPPIDAEKAIPWVETKLGVVLSDSQKEALALQLHARTLVITGNPGVGKTTLIRSIIEVLAVKRVNVALCAPTGKAARRMTESTGREASTIHRLLGINPETGGFLHDEHNPIACDLLIIDESSMLDVPLTHALLKAVPGHAALLFVGDVDQLPSVGPGQVLADLIRSNVIPVVRLTKIFRQAAQSRIVVNAHRVNSGRMPLADNNRDALSDFYCIEVENGNYEKVQDLVTRTVRERIPARFGLDPFRDIQVLCPTTRSGTGTHVMNDLLQQALNPPGPESVSRFGFRFSVRDRVIQTENDYDHEIFNGEVGTVTGIDADAQEIAIDFEGREVRYLFDELDNVMPAYASTVHRAQGAEFPAVVIVLTMQHFQALRRNLLYTAMTRGKRVVVIIGERRALRAAVNGQRNTQRWTKLAEWLALAGQPAIAPSAPEITREPDPAWLEAQSWLDE